MTLLKAERVIYFIYYKAELDSVLAALFYYHH